ncbi:MAG: FMN-binding protein [Calditrichaeota bacterium]|nr:MAG: FMN-binding protein [Calditrichota bacterium]MBL1206637.1 FMN-binding protein [Calditrichota bacterium]NOG46464.1 FMN-binding protein [Calditrichota bacterium]
MNQFDPTKTEKPASDLKMFRAMVGVGIMCALMIVLTYEFTFDVIKQNKSEALEKAVFKVLPGATKKTTYKLEDDESFTAFKQEPQGEQLVYAGFDDNNKLVGIAIEASGQGFQDVLRILYGYSPEKQTVIGYYVLETKETPGLGDKIEKNQTFLDNFTALDVSLNESLDAIKNFVVPVKSGTKENPWEVDCITGATISSKAIGNIISESSKYWVPVIYNKKDSFE